MKKKYKTPSIKVIEMSAEDHMADVYKNDSITTTPEGNDVKGEVDLEENNSSSSTPGSTSIWDEQW